MFIELIMIQCSQKGCDETLDPPERLDLGPIRPMLFKSHSEAIKAGEAAGWFLSSENLGGDVCPTCIAKRQEPDLGYDGILEAAGFPEPSASTVWGPSPLTPFGRAITIRRELNAATRFLTEGYWGPDPIEVEVDERYHAPYRYVAKLPEGEEE
jgi:hypothetical protein